MSKLDDHAKGCPRCVDGGNGVMNYCTDGQKLLETEESTEAAEELLDLNESSALGRMNQKAESGEAE